MQISTQKYKVLRKFALFKSKINSQSKNDKIQSL